MTNTSKSQLAYDWILARIESGRFVPGYRLVLGQIAKELGVSVVPVREAIRRFEAEGLVTFEQNIGAQVAMVNEAEYGYTMELLSLMEGAATALSSPDLTVEQIRRARAVNDEMLRTLNDFNPHRFTELNLEFHSIIFESCPNPQILEQVHRGWSRMKALRESSFSFVPGRAQPSIEEHEELIQLIETGAAPLEIEVAARAHRMATLNAMLKYRAEHKH